MKKTIVLAAAAAFLLCGAALSAQQITRVALVDTARIKDTYFKDSAALRDFNAKQTAIQAQLDQMKAEIKDLQKKKADALAIPDQVKASDLDQQIRKKTDAYLQFGNQKSAELQAEKTALYASSTFAAELYKQIQSVAEANGFVMVLDRQRAVDLQLLIWAAPTVDITDKVIEALDKQDLAQ